MSCKNWLTYLIRCSDDSLYTGITNNLPKRLKAHNDGTASKYTRSRLPVRFEIAKNSMTKSEALKLEARIKKLKKADKERMIKVVHDLAGSDDPVVIGWIREETRDNLLR